MTWENEKFHWNPTEIEPITSEGFRFLGFAKPERFFRHPGRPLMLIHSQPSLDTFSNVIYTPSSRTSKPFRGCLYDQELNRIEASCIKRGTTDLCLNADETHYSGEKDNLPFLDRTVLYLGAITSHYGHFLLESLSRWWPVPEYGSEFDHYLVHVSNPAVLEKPYVQMCLNALKIDPRKIIFFSEPTRIAKVIVPQAAIQGSSHIFTQYKMLCDSIAARYSEVTTTEQPLYLSRRLLTKGVRYYQGEEKLEALLVDRGVRVVHPQLLPFDEQLRVINTHRHILGIMGSAMHTIAFSVTPGKVVYLAPGWVHNNYFLIDSCTGLKSSYINACDKNELLVYWTKLRNKIYRKLRNSDPFPVRYKLNIDAVTNRLKEAGYI